MNTTPEQYETVIYRLANEVCHLRDKLKPITDGQIERGHASPGLPHGPLECGKRKTILKDARQICELVIHRINDAVNLAHSTLHPDIFPSPHFFKQKASGIHFHLASQAHERAEQRGHCEKCGTGTNWRVKVVDRWAYWCGCGN